MTTRSSVNARRDLTHFRPCRIDPPRGELSTGGFGFGGGGGSFRGGLKGDGAGEKAGLAFFAHPIGVALDVDDGGAVQEAIEGGGSHDGIAGEDLAPFGERFVRGDDGGELLFVANADDLEEQRSLLGI